MQRAYFVSDLHITSPEDPKAVLFVRFLRSLSGDRGASHLFLLGDIFDMWLADHRYFIERYRDVIDEIVGLREHGVEIHYFEGNHDLHLRKYWAGELGLAVHSGPLYLELKGHALRLEHGDQMDPDDRGYRFLRWFLRTPPMRFLIYNLPGNVAAWIGERASATSRTYTSEMKTISEHDAVRKIRTHAELVHAECPFDIIISGHVHTRDDYTFEAATSSFRSVNLGTWLDAPCYFLLDESDAQIIELDVADVAQLPQQEPVPATDIS